MSLNDPQSQGPQRVQAYLITVRCYGTLLHGEPGAVCPEHRIYNTPLMEPNPRLADCARARMASPAYQMGTRSRRVVASSILETCEILGWPALAVHVRSNHWHAVIGAEETPERMMIALKAYASRALNQLESASVKKRWARHGSTRYLWTSKQLDDAIHYVLAEQGEPMARYSAVDRLEPG